MKLASANKVRSPSKPRLQEQASIRTVLLAAVSFLLGVAATVFWFQLGTRNNAEHSGLPAQGQSSAAMAAHAPSPAQPLVKKAQPASPATIAEVKRALPHYTSMTVEQGTEILRQAALKEFASAAKAMQAQIAQAQAGLSKAQNSRSAADQQAAMERLRQVQAEQTGKLQQIAAHLQLQLAAFQELKAATTNAAK